MTEKKGVEMPQSATHPMPFPTAFSDFYEEMYPDRQCPADTHLWKDLPEWKFFKAGYNCCAENANARIMNKYAIHSPS